MHGFLSLVVYFSWKTPHFFKRIFANLIDSPGGFILKILHCTSSCVELTYVHECPTTCCPLDHVSKQPSYVISCVAFTTHVLKRPVQCSMLKQVKQVNYILCLEWNSIHGVLKICAPIIADAYVCASLVLCPGHIPVCGCSCICNFFFLQDYPSVGQINAKLRENDIIPIFAVAQSSTTQRSIDIYQVIHYTLAADPCTHNHSKNEWFYWHCIVTPSSKI